MRVQWMTNATVFSSTAGENRPSRTFEWRPSARITYELAIVPLANVESLLPSRGLFPGRRGSRDSRTSGNHRRRSTKETSGFLYHAP